LEGSNLRSEIDRDLVSRLACGREVLDLRYPARAKVEREEVVDRHVRLLPELL
jgi:hypothetical protein